MTRGRIGLYVYNNHPWQILRITWKLANKQMLVTCENIDRLMQSQQFNI